jgi:hypothetical protein
MRINFEEPWNGKVCYIILLFGIFYGLLVYFMAYWKFSGKLVYFLAYCVKKNLATLVSTLVARSIGIGVFIRTNLECLYVPTYRVARFFLVQHINTGKNIPNCHNLYQMAVRFTKMDVK